MKTKIEFHIHTIASPESTLQYDKLLDLADKGGVNQLIICDHDTIAGAQQLQRMDRSRIIIAEEISTNEGEIIGIFLKKMIKPNQSLQKTIAEIKKQDGVVCVPHPVDRMRRKTIRASALAKNINNIDLVEVFNGRSLFDSYNKKALRLAEKYKKGVIWGSDAHTPYEIGRTGFSLNSFHTAGEFLRSLESAEPYTKKSSPSVHVVTAVKKILNKLGKNK